jgi:hypothetical protein
MASNLIAASGEPAFPSHADVAHNPPPYEGQAYSAEKPLPSAPNGGAPPFPEPSIPRAPHEAAPRFPEPSVPGAIPSAGAAGDAASTRSGYSAAFSALPADPSADLNTTAPTPADVEIPAVLFGIPFPAPLHMDASAKKEARRPALLLYAPPRAPYRKPPAGEDGKAGKQKLVKRVERKWQEEVEEAKRLHEGAVPDASRWKKMKAPLARVSHVPAYHPPHADPDSGNAESGPADPVAAGQHHVRDAADPAEEAHEAGRRLRPRRRRL